MELPNPLEYGIFAFVFLLVAELLYTKTLGDHKTYAWKDMGASMAMGAIGSIIGVVMKIFFMSALFVFAYDLCNPIVDGVRMNFMGYKSFEWTWYIFLACQFLDDFTYYWFHRFNHTVRFLWAAHIVHHSSDHYNFGTGMRNGWFTLMYKPFFYVWLTIIGFSPDMVMFCLGIEALWQFQLHTKLVPKLGIIDKVFNTHTMHQAHHAQNIEYLDKNHGGYLNIFDKIFGTWVELDENIEIKYGVVHAPDSYNPLVIATHEYAEIWKDIKRSKNIKEAFMYTFGPPGWSPDGSTLTVKQIHRKLKEGWTIEQLQEKA